MRAERRRERRPIPFAGRRRYRESKAEAQGRRPRLVCRSKRRKSKNFLPNRRGRFPEGERRFSQSAISRKLLAPYGVVRHKIRSRFLYGKGSKTFAGRKSSAHEEAVQRHGRAVRGYFQNRSARIHRGKVGGRIIFSRRSARPPRSLRPFDQLHPLAAARVSVPIEPVALKIFRHTRLPLSVRLKTPLIFFVIL